MRDHPDIPGLIILTDDELSDRLGSAVVARRLVHEWPLTRTEELVLADGRRLACKTQLPPSVEPQFYADARSPLLVAHTDLGDAGRCRVLATEWIDAPTLDDVRSDDDFRRHAAAVSRQIAAIGGEPEVHLDVSTEPGWAAAARATSDRLRSVVTAGRFRRLTTRRIDAFDRWADEPAVRATVTTDTGIVHGDLTADEIFLVGHDDVDRYLVIDWQRPVRGPAGLDRLGLMRGRGLDPAATDELVGVGAFFLLHWAALAATELLPELDPEFFEGWALSSLEQILGPG